ncbi:DEAD/DEAH box helicase [Alkalicoccus daliensis]|uniref:Superfamily I DNA and/or RNA helicase n=1 Tax=Alkalicoccus daliensis TaxID=745820 RepID=A0A1H0GC30_9BACI|nr:DEAD/DEAH box helicase [Alkalicoccus daliensis]SDO04339.1 Superfamily I DNA and/or RNA helicase [Alkalicoccus daliensis]
MSDWKKTLKAWHLIEMLDIPVLPDSNVEYLREGADHTHLPGNETNNNSSPCRIYIGLCSTQKTLEYIRDAFHSEEKFYQMSTEKTFLAALNVNEAGYYEPDSLEIPYFTAFIGQLKKDNDEVNYSAFTDFYKKMNNDLQLKLTSDYKGRVIGESELYKIQSLLIKELNFPSLLLTSKDSDLILVNAIEKFNPNQPLPPLMNSFYIEDLEMLMQKDQLSSALNQYITGTTQKTDIDENEEELMKWLAPSKLPKARWPAPAHHKLSLMQQAAVNIAVDPSTQLNSVNGPPGTGKTTLLKDIIASYYFERAKQMCKFQHPTEAFSDEEAPPELKNKGFQNRFHHLDPSLKSFSMVVASSNNGAVENISKELPRTEELIRDCSLEKDPEIKKREQEIKDLTENLNYFRSHADALLIEEDLEIKEPFQSWGLFSAALGNSKNKTKFANTLWFSNIDGVDKLNNLLKNNKTTIDDWKQAQKEFADLEKQIDNRISFLNQLHEELYELKKNQLEIKKLNNSIAAYEKQLASLNQKAEIQKIKVDKYTEILEASNEESLLWWLTKEGRTHHKLLLESKIKRAEAMKVLMNIEEEQNAISQSIEKKSVPLQKMQVQILKFESQLDELKQKDITIPDQYFWNGEYDIRQKSCPWVDAELNHLRSKAFLQAVKIHKLFVFLASKKVRNNLGIYFNSANFSPNHEIVKRAKKEAWQTLFLIIPVVSTTFASASRLLTDFDLEEIGCLFIDEAGQAVPQAAAGSMYRAKNVVAVGDPLQIEPVVTMPESILHDIHRKFKVDAALCSLEASIQTVADRGNPLGSLQKNGWIGIPLWVHRRCQRPMFDISNEIAYDNKMVLAAEGTSQYSFWEDSTGKSINYQYVEEHGKSAAVLILSLFEEEKTIADVFLITPFKAVAEQLKTELKKQADFLASISNTNKKEVIRWINRNTGTVHTFQGKEARTVLFIVGTDENQQGAAQWIVSKPNILNVAVTRAKKNFILIGDHNRLKQMSYFKEINHSLEKKYLETLLK